MLIKIHEMIDDRLCYEKVRELRWSEGVKCPHCGSLSHRRQGHHADSEHRYCYQCKACQRPYDDLANTVFQDHGQPLKTWIACLYLLRLNLSTAQIAEELGLSENDCRAMCQQLHTGAYENSPPKKEGQYHGLYALARRGGYSERGRKEA